MGFLDDCKSYFDADNLYDLFSVQKNVSNVALKKAYYKLSLRVHPDKTEEEQKEAANRQFQIVTKAYYILSDKEKRAIYDEQGIILDEDTLDDRNWLSYWRTLFPKVTLQDIEDYKAKYKGSEEEHNDLKAYYEKFQGNFLLMCEYIPGHSVSEESRYRELLETMIQDGAVSDYPAFHVEESKRNNAKRVKKAQKEAEEAEATLKEMGLDRNSELTKAITQRQSDRQNSFDNLISSLEAKYSKPKATKKEKNQVKRQKK